MKLIEHVVRNDRPFTEVVTADYIMVSPYTARGYGVFDEVKDKFKNPDDPFEYVPGEAEGARRPEQEQQNQDSATGFYPHAGLLSTFQYLTRYPTTETNRNRLRARMYYQHFLGVDVLELAARVSDAATVHGQVQGPDDGGGRVRGVPQDARPGRRAVPGLLAVRRLWASTASGRAAGSPTCSGPDSRARTCPPAERWRALQWLGERTAKDPRFAVAMVEHVYYILTGRKVLLPPKDIEDPLYPAKLRAYTEQRKQGRAIAAQLREGAGST